MKRKRPQLFLGENMPSSALENFTDEQIAQVDQNDKTAGMNYLFILYFQLYELHVEAIKPIDAEKDPHLAQK